MNRALEPQISVRRTFLTVLAGVFGAALAASGFLWWKYGTAIFFEAIRTGLANCFG
jgi:hypothetical protein